MPSVITELFLYIYFVPVFVMVLVLVLSEFVIVEPVLFNFKAKN